MLADKKLMIIGGGIAGISAALAARNEYPLVHIVLLSREPYPFYNKIALNSFITGKKPREHMQFHLPGWLEDLRIDARWGVGVESLSSEKSGGFLIADDGSQYRYDKLILATGAVPCIPSIDGVNCASVFPIWSLGDAVKIREAMNARRGKDRVVIIGGGVLGVEAAVDLANYGKKVTLIEAKKQLLPLHLDEACAAMYQGFLKSKGIVLNLGGFVARIKELQDCSKVFITDGNSYLADQILITTGVKPDVSLAEPMAIEVNKGISVDSFMNTSSRNILACGNCTEFEGQLDLLWNPAISQGEIAGINAFENKKAWSRSVSSIHVKTGQMPLFICGQMTEGNDTIIIEQSDNTYKVLHINKNQQIKYAVLLNDTDGFYEIQKAINNNRVIDEHAIESKSIKKIVQALKGHEDHDAWVCQMCGYTHEGEYPPEICPVCSVGKDQFQVA